MRRTKKSRPPVDFELTAHAGAEFVPGLRRRLRILFEKIDHPFAAVSFALVGDARMSKLHQQFMNDPSPTDVLTFELEHDSRGRCVQGEIVVCVPEAKRNARRIGTKPADELLLYCLHGLLHLTGMDDRDENDWLKMHETEDRLLQAAGVGRVFFAVPRSRRLPD